jgi:hypothetical protein
MSALSRTWHTSTDSGRSFSALFLRTFSRGGIGLLLTRPAETERKKRKQKGKKTRKREMSKDGRK